jgi:hypothetical protein
MAAFPIATFQFPVVFLNSVATHSAVFADPRVFPDILYVPIDVFPVPYVLRKRAATHTATFPSALFDISAESPTATLSDPVVFALRLEFQSAKLNDQEVLLNNDK